MGLGRDRAIVGATGRGIRPVVRNHPQAVGRVEPEVVPMAAEAARAATGLDGRGT
jgi:hypothetical protein